MNRYLLSSFALFDIAKKAALPPERWIISVAERGGDLRDIFISAVSPMILSRALSLELQATRNKMATATSAAEKAALFTLLGYLETLLENLQQTAERFVTLGLVASMDKRIADRWGKLLDPKLEYLDHNGKRQVYTFHEKIVLATALEGLDGLPFTLVDRHQKVHDTLQISVEDPYA
jgi:hypothetical protein